MTALESLREEWRIEYATTRKFFESYPDGKNDYKLHEKNFTLQQLTVHLYEIFGWPEVIIDTSVLDFEGYERGELPKNRDEMLKALEENYRKGQAALDKATEAAMEGTWEIAMSGKTIHQWPSKYHALRHSVSQVIHHRAQLGVNYRLLGIELPHSYGPTADDPRNFE